MKSIIEIIKTGVMIGVTECCISVGDREMIEDLIEDNEFEASIDENGELNIRHPVETQDDEFTQEELRRLGFAILKFADTFTTERN